MMAHVALLLMMGVGLASAQLNALDPATILIPQKDGKLLPAGGMQFSIPWNGKWYEPPALPANHYRGAYVRSFWGVGAIAAAEVGGGSRLPASADPSLTIIRH
jgi:hypothetical protein